MPHALSRWTLFVCLMWVSSAAVAGPVQTTVLRDEPGQVVISYQIAPPDLVPVEIDSNTHVQVRLGQESPLMEAEAPDLPTVNRSIIIPDEARMSARVLSSTYRDVSWVDVAPSRGILPRSVDPTREPFVFGPVYDRDAFFPGELVTLREPYILRDHRGLVVQLQPVQYNPVTGTLRLYEELVVEVREDGPGEVNVLSRSTDRTSLAFHQLAESHFLNQGPRTRYVPMNEDGELLIIAHDAWLSNVAPLVGHKSDQGISATAVGVSTIGNDSVDNDCDGSVDLDDTECTRTLAVEKTGSLSATVTSMPAGIDCGASCSRAFPVESDVTLTAEPGEADACVGWSGCSAEDALTCSVTLADSSPATTTVSVEVTPLHELTITLEGSGTGVVTSAPVGIDCDETCSESWCEGTSIELTATPAAGSVFEGFSGGGCEGDDTCVVELEDDVLVSATFGEEDTETSGCQCSMGPSTRGVPSRPGLALLALWLVGLRGRRGKDK